MIICMDGEMSRVGLSSLAEARESVVLVSIVLSKEQTDILHCVKSPSP